MNSTDSKVCKVEGCGSKAHAKGYCGSHYGFLKRRGSATAPRLQAPHRSGSVTTHGYRAITVKVGEGFRPRYEHILIAEQVLGKPLPKGAEVHHVNEIRSDNRHNNLVICPNHAYHQLLHRRTRAYDACGHADWLKCYICKKYDDPNNLQHCHDNTPRHRECQRRRSSELYYARGKARRQMLNKQKRLQEI